MGRTLFAFTYLSVLVMVVIQTILIGCINRERQVMEFVEGTALRPGETTYVFDCSLFARTGALVAWNVVTAGILAFLPSRTVARLTIGKRRFARIAILVGTIAGLSLVGFIIGTVLYLSI